MFTVLGSKFMWYMANMLYRYYLKKSALKINFNQLVESSDNYYGNFMPVVQIDSTSKVLTKNTG